MAYALLIETAIPAPCAKSREDFLAALQTLGAKVGPLYRPAASGKIPRRRAYMAFLSCDLETWVRALGEPCEVSQHYDLLTHFPFQAWQQPCADGAVTCVGHLFERAPGRRWVTVARIILD